MNNFRGSARGSNPWLYILVIVSVLLPGSVVLGEDPPLERLRFVIFGQEKQEIGTSRALDGQLELRLFSPAVAAYYTVLIPTSELISAARISPKEMAQIRRQRAQLAQERKRRSAERKRLRALELQEESLSKGSKRSRDSRHPRPGLDSPALSAGSGADEIPKIASSSDARALLRRFDLDVEDLIDRSGETSIEVGSNLAMVEEWIGRSAKTPFFVRRLNSELLDIRGKIGQLEKRLGGRQGEISRYSLQVDRGAIRPRDLQEIGENLKNRIIFCMKNLDTIEARLGAAADAVVALGVPVPEAIVAEAQEPESRVKPRASGSVRTTSDGSAGSQGSSVTTVNALARSKGSPTPSGLSATPSARPSAASSSPGASDRISRETEEPEPALTEEAGEQNSEEPEPEEQNSRATIFLVLGLLCGVVLPTIYRRLMG